METEIENGFWRGRAMREHQVAEISVESKQASTGSARQVKYREIIDAW